MVSSIEAGGSPVSSLRLGNTLGNQGSFQLAFMNDGTNTPSFRVRAGDIGRSVGQNFFSEFDATRIDVLIRFDLSDVVNGGGFAIYLNVGDEDRDMFTSMLPAVLVSDDMDPVLLTGRGSWRTRCWTRTLAAGQKGNLIVSGLSLCPYVVTNPVARQFALLLLHACRSAEVG